jgi:parvulin-like peptidyl-prolyl isomerase
VLAKLPEGQISQPIETTKGIHVLRVEGRTVAGPASFVELQREIAEKLYEQKFSDAITAYLKRLRSRTAVSSPIFDLAADYPALNPEKPKRDSAARPASYNK